MLADDLADALADAPGLTAAELAARLGPLSERAVSFALFSGHRRFRCEMGSPPRWSLASQPTLGAWPAPAAPVVAAGRESPIELYPWQAAALDAWAAAGRRGVVEAVTGTGKTRVGIAAAMAELQRRGQVLVLVPTVELQNQWVAELGSRLAGGAGGAGIGRLGAGGTDRLSSHDVVVAVVNSARAVDVRPIRAGGLVVADECHRYGSAVNHLALDGRFRRRLGLSATYARHDAGNEEWLDPYFGGTCFRLGYRRALSEGVIARFTVTLLGVAFSAEEWDCYGELTDQMRKLFAQLIARHGLPAQPFEAFLAAVAALAGGDSAGSGVARAYRQATLERRRLLADTPAKDAAVEALAGAVGDADRALVFTQSIAAAERGAALLARQGRRAGVVHSALRRDGRAEVLRRFAAGGLDVLCAPRVLDEGIDVPAADLAVIAGASYSRRQMIQRMGRVLRRKPDGRRARFAVLFVEGTVEDPRLGAHEAFLEEIVGIADDVACFAAGAAVEAPGGPRDSLRPSWPSGSSRQ